MNLNPVTIQSVKAILSSLAILTAYRSTQNYPQSPQLHQKLQGLLRGPMRILFCLL